jgi:hypothetical protein
LKIKISEGQKVVAALESFPVSWGCRHLNTSTLILPSHACHKLPDHRGVLSQCDRGLIQLIVEFLSTRLKPASTVWFIPRLEPIMKPPEGKSAEYLQNSPWLPGYIEQ